MKISPAFRLILVLTIFLGQFISLIAYVNNVVARFTIQQQLENQISEAQKKQKTLSNNIEREINNKIALDRESTNLESISLVNLISYQSIQKVNAPTTTPNSTLPSTNAEKIIR